jgi:HAD superfamily hydrolase (TIGR01549 family)
MQKKLFIFDLDGTLTDAYPAIIKSFNGCMRECGFPFQKPAVIRKAVGWGDKELLRPFVFPKALPRVLACYRRRHARDLKSGVSWMPGALLFLRTLKKRGARLAIASNRPTRFTRIIMKHLDAGRFFDKILCADRLTYAKPHPMILRRILKGLSVSRADAVYIGDMVLDVRTGRRAGVTTVAIATGSSTKNQLKREKPDYLFGDLKELRKFLLQKHGS